MNDKKLTAAGGWRYPAPVSFDIASQLDPSRVELPKVSVNRGGFTYPPQPGTPEWERLAAAQRAQEGLMAMVRRMIGKVVTAQDDAIESAWLTRPEGHSLHVYEPRPGTHSPPAYRYGVYKFIGIGFEPTRGRVEAIWRHQITPYDDWEDDE